MQETQRESGLYVPQTVQKQVNRAKIELLGNKVKPSDVFPTGLDVGQTIIYKEGSGIEYDHEGKSCKIIFDYDIIAIV